MKKILFMLATAILSILASAQTRRALVIGISDYPQNGSESWGVIHGANDAELIVPILQGQGFKTTKICNEAATALKIRKALNTLVKTCSAGDIVYLHFSCHGQPFEDLNGDEEYGWDTSIIPYDAQKVFKKGKYEGQNHIIDDSLHTYFQKIRKKIGESGFVCVVVDACYAGGSSRGIDETENGEDDVFVRGTKIGFTFSGKEFRPRINTNRSFKIQQEPGLADITILEACRHYQTNHEIKQSGEYYGPLSYCISLVLKNKKLTKSLDWVKDVETQMENRCKNRLTGRPIQDIVCETSLNENDK